MRVSGSTDRQLYRLLRDARRDPFLDGPEAQARFLRVPAPVRKEAILTLVHEKNYTGLRLALRSDARFLRGMDPEERQAMWRGILGTQLLNYIGHFFVPTRRKAVDLFTAVMTLEPGQLRQPRAEYVAHLMSYLRWPDIPARFKRDALFAEMGSDSLRQSVLSVIRDRGMEQHDLAFREICENMEGLYLHAMEKGRLVTLVNNHMLFVNTVEWDLALCLRNFVSASGSVFLKGIYYFCSARDQIINARVRRMMVEGAAWIPTRLYKPSNVGQPFDLDRLARLFPRSRTTDASLQGIR